jgi:hypothetical protein
MQQKLKLETLWHTIFCLHAINFVTSKIGQKGKVLYFECYVKQRVVE